jgi:hypothetical protein
MPGAGSIVTRVHPDNLGKRREPRHRASGEAALGGPAERSEKVFRRKVWAVSELARGEYEEQPSEEHDRDQGGYLVVRWVAAEAKQRYGVHFSPFRLHLSAG